MRFRPPPEATPPAVDPVEEFLDAGALPGRLRPGDLLAFLAYGLLILGYFLPAASSTRLLGEVDGDLMVNWYWMRDYLGQVLRAGDLPVLTPFLMSGHPYLASSQSAVFYPLNWLFAFVPVVWLINAQIVLHFWAGIASMHLLMRRAGRSIWAAALAGLVFGFSGFTVIHWYYGHLPFVLEWPFLPLAVLAWMEIVRGFLPARGGAGWRGFVWPIVGLGVVLALQIFAGQPQITYYTLLILAGLHGGWVLWALRRRHAVFPLLRGSVALAAGGLLALALSAVHLLPVLAFSEGSIREGGIPRDEQMVHSVPPSHVVLLVAPHALGDSVRVPYLRPADEVRDYHEVLCFVGSVPVLLSLVALVLGGRRGAGLRATLAVLALISWWLSLGHYGRLYDLLSGVLPGLSSFRAPGRFGLLVTFALAWLSALGLDGFRAAAQSENLRAAVRRAVLVPAVIIAALGVLLLLLFRDGAASSAFQSLIPDRLQPHPAGAFSPEFYFERFSISLAVSALVACGGLLLLILFRVAALQRVTPGLLVVLATGDLLLFAGTYQKSVDPQPALWPPAVQQLLGADQGRWRVGTARSYTDWVQGTSARVRHVWGAEPLFRIDYAKAIMTSQRIPVDGRHWPQMMHIFYSTPFTRALGMRWLLIPSSRMVAPPWELRRDEGSFRVMEDREALPRGYTVASARVLGATEDPAVAVNRADFLVTSTVLLQEPLPAGFDTPLPSDAATSSPPGRVEIASDKPEFFEARVEMDRQGWFVLMDQFLPGWTAEVDGQPAHLYRGNAVGRALPLPAGSHQVTMRYQAPGLKPGMVISALSWGLCALILMLARSLPGRQIAPDATVVK